MIALVRYVAADALRAQRWLAPVVVFLAAVTVLDVGGGSVLSCYSPTAATLMAVALWLTVVVVGSEDPIQTAVTVVTVGGASRVRLAKLLTAYLVALPLVAVGVLWPLLIGGHDHTAAGVGAGVVAHLLTALTGVGFGALLSRPVLRHTGWTVLAGVAVCLAELAVPGAPPARQLLALLGADPPRPLAGPLALIAVQAVALAAVTIALGARIARTRS